MNEPRTLELLYECIEREYAWRITELSNYRSFVISSSGKAKEAILKAGLALLYAHWEGFIKRSSDFYYSFVSYQNMRICDLNDCFISIVLRREIERLLSTKKLSIHKQIIQTFFQEQDKIAMFTVASPIRTSNLKYNIFEDVCILIGIDINELHERYKNKGYDRDIKFIIDIDLVDKRNSIAHGDFCSIKENEFKELYDVVINGIIYCYKESIMDNAQNKKYLR